MLQVQSLQWLVYHCTSRCKCLTNDFHHLRGSALQLQQHDRTIFQVSWTRSLTSFRYFKKLVGKRLRKMLEELRALQKHPQGLKGLLFLVNVIWNEKTKWYSLFAGVLQKKNWEISLHLLIWWQKQAKETRVTGTNIYNLVIPEWLSYNARKEIF